VPLGVRESNPVPLPKERASITLSPAELSLDLSCPVNPCAFPMEGNCCTLVGLSGCEHFETEANLMQIRRSTFGLHLYEHGNADTVIWRHPKAVETDCPN